MNNTLPTDNQDSFQGTNLNENTWVPFNDETQVPPRPEPTVGQVTEEPQQIEPQYVQHPYMEMMPPPSPQEDKGWMAQIQQVPIATAVVLVGMGLLLGFMMTNNRRPIILNGPLP